MWLVVKKAGMGMPENVAREELDSLYFRVQGVRQLRPGRCDQEPTNYSPTNPNFIVSVACGTEVSKVQSITELCGLCMSV